MKRKNDLEINSCLLENEFETMFIACLKNEVDMICIEMGNYTVSVRTWNLWPKVDVCCKRGSSPSTFRKLPGGDVFKRTPIGVFLNQVT
jgi:hypothetical protein